MSLSRTALVILFMRISNTALMMIGPILLVRLLSVEEFGTYREFLVYISVLLPITSFAFNQSLMYFVPAFPGHTWLLVRQTVLATAVSSVTICGGLWILNWALNGHILGQYGAQILIYTLFCVNVDFWEFLWISQQRTSAAFAYTSGRLIVRLCVILIVAAVTHSVTDIINWLLAMEATRLIACAIAWRRLSRKESSSRDDLWKAQFRYCLPLGASRMVAIFNRYIGNILIARMIGPTGLAQYSIGTYAVPVLYEARNSVSDAILPRMAKDSGGDTNSVSLALWYRSNALFAMMLVPVGVLLARYAELFVVTLFSENYLPAVVVFQVYLLAILSDTVDFGVALRLLGITTTFVRGSILGTAVNLGLLLTLLPRIGITGAVIALVVTQLVVFGYYAHRVARATRTRIAQAANLHVLLRVILAAIVPIPLLALPAHAGIMDLLTASVSAAVYVAAYVALLHFFGSLEIKAVLHDCRRMIGSFQSRRSSSS